MSYGPPVLPPVPGTPNGPRDYPGTPPFVGNDTTFPPWLGSASISYANPTPTAAPTDYLPGPYCFGIDKYICSALPETIHIGGAKSSLMERYVGGIDIPVWKFCLALTNTLCAMFIVIVLLTVLGIAFAGLVF